MRVVVGSRDTPLSWAVFSSIATTFATLQPDEAIGIRIDQAGDAASPLENIVAAIAEALDRQVIRFAPTNGGRAAVFHRDYDLVGEASGVLAFFAPGREMEGGTGHVVKAALDREIPVEAFGVDPQGSLTFIGSDEGNPERMGGPSRPAVLLRMWEEMHGA